MAPEIELVVRLQRIDDQIRALTREIQSLPRQIQEIEQTLAVHQRQLEAEEAALRANQKERRRLEGEIQMLEQKISKLKDQTFEVKTNEQYWALQHEIEYCQGKIREFEDRVLELMLESETLEQNVERARRALEQERLEVERRKREAQEKAERDRQELERARQQRAEIVRQLNPDLYRLYERVSKRYNGFAVARGIDGQCSACHIVMRPQFYQDLRKAEQIMICESCGRLLYYAEENQVGESEPAHPGGGVAGVSG